MFDQKKNQASKFVFDLEKEIKETPGRAKTIQERVETQIQEIKKNLREGANEKDFDKLGVLLHGYTALQKVLRKVK